MNKQDKITFAMVFSVAAVLFSSHAGGGFATGNQANTYYVGLGWAGLVAAVLSIFQIFKKHITSNSWQGFFFTKREEKGENMLKNKGFWQG